MYAYRIDNDYINDPEESRAGKVRCSDRVQVREIVENWNNLDKEEFQIYDDDGNLDYDGELWTDGSATLFEPLDWAQNDVGSTEIRYKNKETGKYETL